MKLRLRGDSIRLRLTAKEVIGLRDQGWWQDASTLGPVGSPRLVYRVESSEAGNSSVQLVPAHDTVITVALPQSEVITWANSSSQVGLYFEEPWGLKVAVEKDFRCLDPRRDEDESDNYDNPNAGTSHHDGACDAD